MQCYIPLPPETFCPICLCAIIKLKCAHWYCSVVYQLQCSFLISRFPNIRRIAQLTFYPGHTFQICSRILSDQFVHDQKSWLKNQQDLFAFHVPHRTWTPQKGDCPFESLPPYPNLPHISSRTNWGNPEPGTVYCSTSYVCDCPTRASNVTRAEQEGTHEVFVLSSGFSE